MRGVLPAMMLGMATANAVSPRVQAARGLVQGHMQELNLEQVSALPATPAPTPVAAAY